MKGRRGTDWMDMSMSLLPSEELKLNVSLSLSSSLERTDSDCGMVTIVSSPSSSSLPTKRTCVALALLGVVGLWKRRLRIGIGRWVLGVPGVKFRSTRAPMRGLVVFEGFDDDGDGSQHILMGSSWNSCRKWLW